LTGLKQETIPSSHTTDTIRKKGDWASLHIERQAANLLDDEQHWGYSARFAVGLQHAKKLASWYFDLPYEESSELFFLVLISLYRELAARGSPGENPDTRLEQRRAIRIATDSL
jgi:hypothetical protein